MRLRCDVEEELWLTGSFTLVDPAQPIATLCAGYGFGDGCEMQNGEGVVHAGFDCTCTLAVESVDVEEDTQLTLVAFFLMTYTVATKLSSTCVAYGVARGRVIGGFPEV